MEFRNEFVHLDVKPANIMKKSDRFKLGDFGLALHTDHGQAASGMLEEGDCKYMARELLDWGPKDLTKCDIFSLGITVFEIVTKSEIPANGEYWQSLRNGTFNFPNEIKTSSMSNNNAKITSLKNRSDSISSIMVDEYCDVPKTDDGFTRSRLDISDRMKEILRVLLTPDPATRPGADECLERFFGIKLDTTIALNDDLINSTLKIDDNDYNDEKHGKSHGNSSPLKRPEDKRHKEFRQHQRIRYNSDDESNDDAILTCIGNDGQSSPSSSSKSYAVDATTKKLEKLKSCLSSPPRTRRK